MPPQSAPEFVANSPLAAQNGFMDVDKETLQSNKYPNVFGLGDICNVPTAKTAAAIFSMSPVVVHNMLKHMGHNTTTANYSGYASCPVFCGDNKLMLIEFKYGGSSDTTFFADQTKPKRSFFHLKKDLLPLAYFNLMPKGRWFGRYGLSQPKF